MSPLFTPHRMDDLDLPNRIVMAPLTRMRARSDPHVPTELQAEYYAQRTTAGLIVSEGIAISPEGFGWANTPGSWTEDQIRGWSHVTDAVHAAGGRILSQLWHTGAMSHPDLLGDAQPLSASGVDPEQRSVTPAGRVPTVAPRPMTRDEIRQTVADYASAARGFSSRLLRRSSKKSIRRKLVWRPVPSRQMTRPCRWRNTPFVS